ncbi:hypothetical protein CO033_01120 [Candidatus Nomurabacteria bacterium CG_4_9_14_0_2_um_filter_32_10]|uniref:NAD-dependent epimerase/dehydratase domain-containing protein n=3 Tax=Candidatus Nomuraibacteriota TaxID=1752729 RepID=A0A2H0CGZ0_9BACT|nr:MAG: hypothetical protein COW91_00685 [Candidatus Nomurabacteria bacterium CG22_combo_CG10-13_8_21_14_all_32_8]PIZ85585.1 MAG: hypothetical protein COX94_02440 [Candidatus Nomurabacteria bacterium CG_4_10_14_0_2_um_filter_33_9]PJC49517.1 MAG: hypothetical protein CO033_01120 [Candidatus Nomurabacteria bacterium CG_4_9_14_0_2_um_filter_32_10]
MTTIGLFGASGFVGKKLHTSLIKKGYAVFPITRDNYSEHIGKFYDIVINSAMPSARFLAKIDPEKDFKETVQKTADIFYNCTFNKFIQISTVSARCQLDTVYGKHKLAAENICNCDNNLIIRLTSMFADNLEKGVLIDMLKDQKVFVDKESRYSFADIDFVTDYIASNLDKSGLLEVGAHNSVKLKDIAKYLGVNIEFDGTLDIQEIENNDKELPDAREVFKFIDNYKMNFQNAKNKNN